MFLNFVLVSSKDELSCIEILIFEILKNHVSLKKKDLKICF